MQKKIFARRGAEIQRIVAVQKEKTQLNHKE
jgi:hypothetical protein